MSQYLHAPAYGPADPTILAGPLAQNSTSPIRVVRLPELPPNSFDRLLPGIIHQRTSSLPGRVRLEVARAEQHPYVRTAQDIEASVQHGVVRESRVHKGQDGDRHARAGEFCELCQDVGVGDARRPLVDRVVGGRCDDHRVGRGKRPLALTLVAGSHSLAGELVQFVEVEEVLDGGWCGDAVDRPSRVLGKLDGNVDVFGG